MDVAHWLRQLGLERYEAAFRENDVSAAILPNLTAEDLKELGVISVGHRRRLLEAIATLRTNAMPAGDPVQTARRRPRHDPRSTETTAERRPLTVMFCDLVGSTALSSRLDPEDLREVIGAYQGCVAAVLTQFDGFIAKYVGDGVLTYFGWPEAHEADAERAVRAGLRSSMRWRFSSGRAAAGAHRHRHGPRGRRRADRLGLGARADGGRRDTELGRSPAGSGRAQCGGDRCCHTPADRRPVRMPGSRPGRR